MEKYILKPKNFDNEKWKYSWHKKIAITNANDEQKARENVAVQLLNILNEAEKDYASSPWLDKDLVECRKMLSPGNGKENTVFI